MISGKIAQSPVETIHFGSSTYPLQGHSIYLTGLLGVRLLQLRRRKAQGSTPSINASIGKPDIPSNGKGQGASSSPLLSRLACSGPSSLLAVMSRTPSLTILSSQQANPLHSSAKGTGKGKRGTSLAPRRERSLHRPPLLEVPPFSSLSQSPRLLARPRPRTDPAAPEESRNLIAGGALPSITLPNALFSSSSEAEQLDATAQAPSRFVRSRSTRRAPSSWSASFRAFLF